MNVFVLLFRMDITTPKAQPTAAQMRGYMKQWNAWIASLADRKRLAPGGTHLSRTGAVLRPGSRIARTPYTAGKQSVAGFIFITARNVDEALALAGECPILKGTGTSVEVRAAEGAR